MIECKLCNIDLFHNLFPKSTNITIKELQREKEGTPAGRSFNVPSTSPGELVSTCQSTVTSHPSGFSTSSRGIVSSILWRVEKWRIMNRIIIFLPLATTQIKCHVFRPYEGTPIRGTSITLRGLLYLVPSILNDFKN